MPCSSDDLFKWAPVASAVFAAIAAGISAINVWLQNRNASKNRSLDMLVKKEAEFEGPRMREIRRLAAKALKSGETESQAIDDLLDFMESVGMLVASESLDENQAWSSFYHCFANYGHACKSIIASEQAKDATIWQDCSALLTRLDAVQMKRSRLARRFSQPEVEKFLSQEEKAGV